MEKYLYHGSIVSDITELHPNSKTHDGQNALYLTDSFPYSLFYIWDSEHNIKKSKHITSWIKDGVVYYEEQFENQLKRFYDGVSGYVYIVSNSDKCFRVTDCESMWYSKENVPVSEVIYIPNVYDEIQKYVADGKVKIISFAEVDKSRIETIYEIIAKRIVKDNLLDNPECDEALFYRTFFMKAWEKLQRINCNNEKQSEWHSDCFVAINLFILYNYFANHSFAMICFCKQFVECKV